LALHGIKIEYLLVALVKMTDTINFGTYRLGKDTYSALGHALECGYRAIDTASLYKVEDVIGQYISENRISRSELKITSKLNPKIMEKSESEIIGSIRKTLAELNTDYLDLFLIHAPKEEHIIKCWNIIETFYKNGIFKNIGVSNFDVHHMEAIRNFSTTPIYTNQLELSPFLKRPNVVKYMREKGIRITAHSSLAKGEKFNDPVLVKMASKYNRSSAQIMLAWAKQNDYSIIPRSSNKSHIAEDITLDFTISESDMNELNGITDIHITHPQYILS
jgi:diketogulonate reductase-like aldo/keto reductase